MWSDMTFNQAKALLQHWRQGKLGIDFNPWEIPDHGNKVLDQLPTPPATLHRNLKILQPLHQAQHLAKLVQ